MGVTSYTLTQYDIRCDCCGVGECCPDSWAERVHSKQQAIKWAGMHKTKDGDILCNRCFKEYKENKRKNEN